MVGKDLKSKVKDSDKNFSIFFRPEKAFSLKYDEIVDPVNFKTTKQLIEDMTASELNTVPTKGLYDFEEGATVDFSKFSYIELLLRDGKLDKAEVQKLIELEKQNLVTESERQALQAENLSNKERSAKIDKILEKQSAELV